MKRIKILSCGLVFLLLITVPLISPLAAPVSDPIGDTFGSNSVIIDITEINILFTSSEMGIWVPFTQPVFPAYTGNAYDLYGVIELDVDQNSSTGDPSEIDDSLPIGVDYMLVFFSLNDNDEVALTDLVGSSPVRFVYTEFNGNQVFLAFDLDWIGADDGFVNYAAIFGDEQEPDDIVPNSGFATSSPIPIPGAVWLLGSGLIGLVGLRKKLKK